MECKTTKLRLKLYKKYLLKKLRIRTLINVTQNNMKQGITILLLLAVCRLIGQDTTNYSLIKEYKINNSEIKNVVKITYDNELTFYSDKESFFKFSSSQLNIFKEYNELFKGDKWYKRKYNKKFNDTLCVDIKCYVDTDEYYKKTYFLEIKFETYNNKYYSKLTESDTSFSPTESDTSFNDDFNTIQIQLIEKFYNDTKDYILSRIINKKRMFVYNELKGKFEDIILKEKFSYYYGPLAAGGGIWFRIKGTNFILKRNQKWIS